MTNFKPEENARYNGLLQAFTGIGMMMGPLLGSLLYELGGFALPFIVVSVLLFILCICVGLSLKTDP